MADWRALNAGVKTGMALGKDMRERKGRRLFGEGISPETQTYEGAIPMPDEQVAAMQDAVEGPLPQEQTQHRVNYEWTDLEAARRKMLEGYEMGGVDDEMLMSGLENLATRGYIGANEAYENALALWDTDPQAAAQEVTKLYGYIPDGQFGIAVPDGQGGMLLANMDPETGQPTGDGIPLTQDTLQKIMHPLTNPEGYMQMYGMMSLQEIADLDKTKAETASKRGEERRAKDLHPTELEGADADIEYKRSLSDYYRSGGSRSRKSSEPSASEYRQTLSTFEKMAQSRADAAFSRAGSKAQQELYGKGGTGGSTVPERAMEYYRSGTPLEKAFSKAEKDLIGVGGDASQLSPVAGSSRTGGGKVSAGASQGNTSAVDAVLSKHGMSRDDIRRDARGNLVLPDGNPVPPEVIQEMQRAYGGGQ